MATSQDRMRSGARTRDSPTAPHACSSASAVRAPYGVFRSRAVADFLASEDESEAFVQDRRPEGLLFTQHAGGFFRRLETAEQTERRRLPPAQNRSTQSDPPQQQLPRRRLPRRITDAEAWLRSATAGHYTSSLAAGDCNAGSRGAFELSQFTDTAEGWARAAAVCLEHCAACARCTHISVSVRHRDCTWVHAWVSAGRGARKLNIEQRVPGFRSGPALVRVGIAHPTKRVALP